MTLALLLCQLFFPTASAADGNDFAPLHIQQAAFIASNAQTPPSFDGSNTVDLPYHWQAEDFRSGWFQLIFPVESEHNQFLSFYLPRVNMNAAVFLNGEFVGSGGSMEAPVDRHWHSPMLFQLPGSLFKRGENSIQIRVVTSQPGTIGLLGEVVLGPENIVNPMYEWNYFIHHGINLATIFLSLLMGIIILCLWWMRRKGEYLWFGIVNLVAAFSYLNMVVIFIPVSTRVWEWLMLFSIGWIPVLMAVFIHHMTGKGWTGFDKLVAGFGLIFIPVLWFVPQRDIFDIARVWHVVSLAIGLIALVELIVFLHKSRSGALYIVWLCIAVLAICGTHDMLTVIESGSRFWAAYSPLVMIFGISILLIHRFAAAANELESVNATLENRVVAAQQQIEHDMQLIAEMEKEQAVNQERSRIYRDLHDDLGAKILSLVYKSENPEQKALAHEAMEQLRKIVSSSRTRAVKLNNMIRFWREDCVRRAVEAGISVSWKLKEHAYNIELDAHTVSQISHVFREAITNALKHGNGKQLNIRARCRDGHLIISVKNDTLSTLELNAVSGNGIANMRNRIASLGGQIRWRISKTGFRVTWAIPLESVHASTDI